MTPRGYQQATIDAVRAEWSSGANAVLAQCPTGGGKTLIASELMEGFDRVIFMAHRRNLILQASEHLDAVGRPHAIIAAGYPIRGERVQVASVDTLASRLSSVRRPDLLVIDECHHVAASSFRRIADWAGGRVLGLTATPWRLDGSPLGDVFETMVPGPPVRHLIDQGYLSPFRYFAPPAPAGTIEDLDDEELAELMDRPAITGNAVDHYRRHASGLPALAFCASIAHAEHVSATFKAAGFRSMAIHSGLPEDAQKGMLRMLRNGDVDVLTNCGIIDEGTDVPGVAAVIDLAPTASLSRFLQRCGRALRPVYADGEGSRQERIARGPKPYAVILDHAGNVERHGLPDDERDWSLEGRGERQAVAKLKRCESCYEMVPIASRVCPACGAEFDVKERGRRDLEEGDGELVERMSLYDAVKLGGDSIVHARGIAVTLGHRPEIGERIFREVFGRGA